jgi:hypothetical protein
MSKPTNPASQSKCSLASSGDLATTGTFRPRAIASAISRVRAQTFQVIQIASMHLGAGGDERLGARLRPHQSKYLMACVE